MTEKRLKVTLRRSLIGRHKVIKQTARALGLRRIGQTVVHPDNPSIRGMLRRVADIVEVEPVEGK